MTNNPNLAHLGVVFPKETIKKLDERKGPYYSRSKYLLKIVEEHLNEEDKEEVALIANTIEKAE